MAIEYQGYGQTVIQKCDRDPFRAAWGSEAFGCESRHHRLTAYLELKAGPAPAFTLSGNRRWTGIWRVDCFIKDVSSAVWYCPGGI